MNLILIYLNVNYYDLVVDCFKIFSGVHRCYFTSDNKSIASFSDDKTVKIWDVATESETIEFSSHEVISVILHNTLFLHSY